MTNPLLMGMEGVFIPVKDPKLSANWYEEILGFKLLYIEEEGDSKFFTFYDPDDNPLGVCQ